MNNSQAPKIVIGVGLVAIYATGAFVLMPRDTHGTIVAQTTADAPTAQTAEFIPPPAVAPAPAEDSTATAEVPAAAPAAVQKVVASRPRAREKTIVSDQPAASAGEVSPGDAPSGDASSGDTAHVEQSASQPADSGSQISTDSASQAADVKDSDVPAATTNN